MYFGIYGEDEIDSIKLRGNSSILIRICGDRCLNTSALYKEILYLDIEDIVNFDNLTDKFKINLVKEFIKLNEFILKNDFDEIIIHCALGISRSPAIMICVSKILGSFEMEKIIKEKFLNYNKIIVSEFEKFDFTRKEIDINKIVFVGHFINNKGNNFIVEPIDNNKYNLILKLKKY